MVFQTQVPISLVILVIDIQDLYTSKYKYTIIVFIGVWLSLMSIAILWSSVELVKLLLEGKTLATALKSPHLLHKENHSMMIM